VQHPTHISKPEESESACKIDQQTSNKGCGPLTASIIDFTLRAIPPARDPDDLEASQVMVMVVEVAQKWTTFSKVSGPRPVPF
jgi:hypothetical protein